MRENFTYESVDLIIYRKLPVQNALGVNGFGILIKSGEGIRAKDRHLVSDSMELDTG